MLVRIGNVIYYPCAVLGLLLVLLGVFGTHADGGLDFIFGGGLFAVGWGARYILSGNNSFK